MSEVRWHGDALDAAIDAANAPDEIGVCVDALHSRCQTFIDQQLENSRDPEYMQEIRDQLVEAGLDVDDELVNVFALRGVVGGSWTHGLAVGLALAALPETGENDGD